MNNLVETDYMVVQARTLPVIASEIHQIERTVYGVALDGAIQIGRKLQEAKAMIPSGEWVKWLDENLNYSQRQAYNFMEIADNYGDENSPFYDLQTSANVSISKALELLRLPEEEVKSFAEEHDIESETVKNLRDEINNLKRERDRAKDSNESLRKDLARAQSDLAEAMTQEDADRIRGQYEAAREELQTENAKIKEEQSELQAKLDQAKEDLKKQKAKLKEIKASMDEEVQKRQGQKSKKRRKQMPAPKWRQHSARMQRKSRGWKNRSKDSKQRGQNSAIRCSWSSRCMSTSCRMRSIKQEHASSMQRLTRIRSCQIR